MIGKSDFASKSILIQLKLKTHKRTNASRIDISLK